MKAYLCGPMTGYPNYNYDEFAKGASYLRGLGYEVINPAEFFDGDQSLHYTEYMRRDVEEMLKADLVYCLPRWSEGTGARLEVAVALGIGLPVFLLIGTSKEYTNFYPIFSAMGGRDVLAKHLGVH